MRTVGWMLMVSLLAAAPAAGQAPKTLTVDASGDGAYVRLGDEASVVAVADPRTSSDWDIAFLGTSIIVNGGEAGPGAVTGYCVCQNAGAENEAIREMTPESELADFTAVGREQIPADGSAWNPVALAAAPWYRYNVAGQHLIWPTYDVYLLRRGDSLYKVQIIGYYGADGTPRQLTFRYGSL